MQAHHKTAKPSGKEPANASIAQQIERTNERAQADEKESQSRIAVKLCECGRKAENNKIELEINKNFNKKTNLKL